VLYILYFAAPIWMTFAYQNGLEHAPWWYRGLGNTAMILTGEYLSMWGLACLLGDSPSGREYRNSGDSINGFIRIKLIPVWFCATFFLEFCHLSQFGRLPSYHFWVTPFRAWGWF
jgi:hypothetical protein